jgi:hypothetical protein
MTATKSHLYVELRPCQVVNGHGREHSLNRYFRY